MPSPLRLAALAAIAVVVTGCNEPATGTIGTPTLLDAGGDDADDATAGSDDSGLADADGQDSDGGLPSVDPDASPGSDALDDATSSDVGDTATGDAPTDDAVDAVSGDIEDAADDTGGDDVPTTDVTIGPTRWAAGNPSSAGPYEVTRVTERAELDAQNLDLILFLPTDGEDAPYPVVVFNHGFSMQAAQYAPYGERLASHGFVVVLPNIGDSLWSPRSHVHLGAVQVQLNAWLAAAARTPGSRLFGVADTPLLGVGGHSRGGKASMLAATIDGRIRASFNIDPVDAPPPEIPFVPRNPADFPSVTPELMGALTIPTGYVGAGRGAQSIAFGPPCAPEDDNYHQYFIHSPTPSFEYVVEAAGHNDFIPSCDRACRFACPNGDSPEDAVAFAATTMVAFYKVFLAGDDTYRPWVDGDLVGGATLSTR